MRCLPAIFGLLAFAASARAEPGAGVAVLHAAPWSQGDELREGAGEFEVLLQAARLQQSHRIIGIVGVGDRHGLFNHGAERALRLLVLRGTPVVKLARGSDLAPDPDRLFIDARELAEGAATAILQRCLERHGPIPSAADPEHPTQRELTAIRAHLRPFQEAFARAAAPQPAVRPQTASTSPEI